MTLVKRARLLAFSAAFALAAFSMPASAQEVSDSHMQAARAAIDAIDATDDFDNFLPQAAQTLKAELIQQSPNMVDLINATVDKTAIQLASRRADLEREAALAYARVFSEEELKSITEFYNSPAGEKLIADGPIVTREVRKAAEIWRRGVARDLSQNVMEQLEAARGAQAPAEDANAQ